MTTIKELHPMHRTGWLVLPLLAVTACGGGGSGGTSSVTSNGTVAAAGSPTAQTAQVDGQDVLKFKPNVVTAKVGALTLTMHNAGQVPHNLEFDDSSLGKLGLVSGGQSKQLKLTFAKAGTFTFQCTIHPGMTGKVIVS